MGNRRLFPFLVAAGMVNSSTKCDLTVQRMHCRKSVLGPEYNHGFVPECSRFWIGPKPCVFLLRGFVSAYLPTTQSMRKRINLYSAVAVCVTTTAIIHYRPVQYRVQIRGVWCCRIYNLFPWHSSLLLRHWKTFHASSSYLPQQDPAPHNPSPKIGWFTGLTSSIHVHSLLMSSEVI